METWATRPPRIAAYALVACVGAFVWLLLATASASADEGTRPSAGPAEAGPALADLRSTPSPLGQRGSATGPDRSLLPDLRSDRREASAPARPASTVVSLERTVEEVADVAASGQREVSRTVDRVADGLPVGDRAVQEVTRQVDQTTDAALGTVTTVVRTVDVAVTEPLDRPAPGQPPVTDGDGDDPGAAPEETSTAPADRVAQTDLVRSSTRKSVGPRPRAASDIDAPRGRGVTLPPAAFDPTHHPVLPEGPRASGASGVDDAPPASPGDEAPDLGGDATATSSADGGSGGLAVLDGRPADRAGGTPMCALPPGHRPRGPSFDPGFSPD